MNLKAKRIQLIHLSKRYNDYKRKREAMKKIVLGLSGGVDSAYCAKLLIDEGYDVLGVYAVMTDESDFFDAAAQLAGELGISIIRVDARERFYESVIKPFVNEYLNGRTPNPCVLCNPFVKLKILAEEADKAGADEIATGHYTKPVRLENQRYSFAEAADKRKDQGYFLYKLPQEIISRFKAPLFNRVKTDLKEEAKRSSISVYKNKESEDICFINGNYVDYLKKHVNRLPPPGKFIDLNGKVLGQHSGIYNYTVGQRKGLGVALGQPAFVRSIDPVKNTVSLCFTGEEYFAGFLASKLNFVGVDDFDDNKGFQVKVRYAAKKVNCFVERINDDEIKVSFEQPQRAVAPGQSAVFYREDGVIAFGGTIDKAF